MISVKIRYEVLHITHGVIKWRATEDFGELFDKTYSLKNMSASDITEIQNLSIKSKILLSAIAGALIQHLLDRDIDAEDIFSKGTFCIERGTVYEES